MQTTDVREAAQSAVNQSKSFLGKQLDDRTTQVGQQISSVAQDLRNVGDQLRGSGMGGGFAAGYVDQGAAMIDRVARYLQDADSDQLVGDLEDVARRQPWAFAAGALVLGFAASRFLKTSSARRYRDTEYGQGTQGGYGMSGSYGSSSSYGSGSYGSSSTYGSSGTTGGGYGSSGTGYGSSGTGGAGTYGASGTTSGSTLYDGDETDRTGIRSGGERYAT